jgi:hypothetical protein
MVGRDPAFAALLDASDVASPDPAAGIPPRRSDLSMANPDTDVDQRRRVTQAKKMETRAPETGRFGLLGCSGRAHADARRSWT